MNYKVCPSCNVLKSFDDFHNENPRPDGKSVYCKECKSKQYLKSKGRTEKIIRNPKSQDGYRVCSICKQEFPETQDFFGKQRRNTNARGITVYHWRTECLDCRRKQKNESNARHRDTTIRRNHRWYAENGKQVNAERRQRYVEDDEYREKIIRDVLERQKDNPEKSRFYWQNRRDRVQQAEGELTEELIREVYDESGGICAYCGVDCHTDWHLDHIIPLDRDGTNLKDNLCIACPSCNTSKGNKLLSEWTDRIYERKSNHGS